METFKASLHMGRLKGKSSGKHNDRSFDTTKNESIKYPEDSKYNEYYVTNDSGKFIPVEGGNGAFEKREREFYAEHFKDGLEAKNERYRANGHKENCKSITAVRKSPKTAPMEMILQLENENHKYVRGDNFKKMIKQFTIEMRSEYPDFRILDYGIHFDEESAHCHIRGVFVAKDDAGNEIPNQTKSLQGMGFTLPNPEAKRSQTNNELVSFTSVVREKWQDVIEHVDPEISIDRQVSGVPRRHKNQNKYKAEKLAEEIEKAERSLKNMDSVKYDAMQMFLRENNLEDEFEKFYEKLFDYYVADFGYEY